MRFAERFFVAFALLSVIMRIFGLKDAPTLELIALPLLAVFYLLCMPFIIHGSLRKMLSKAWSWLRLIIGILIGGALAYCIISFMMYTLNWLPRLYMLENCSILLGAISVAGFIAWRRRSATEYIQPGLRAAIMLGIILIVALIPLPHIGALSRGAP